MALNLNSRVSLTLIHDVRLQAIDRVQHSITALTLSLCCLVPSFQSSLGVAIFELGSGDPWCRVWCGGAWCSPGP